MFPARTSAGPRLSRRSVTGSSDVHRSTRSLRFRMTSVTSALTPLITSNSWSASSNRTCVTDAPGIDESNVRRKLLPRVWPKPGSRGAIVKRCRLPSASPASISGRWMISMQMPSVVWRVFGGCLLGVELDDELLAHRDLDLLPEREVAHRHLELGRNGVEPLRHGAVEGVDVVANHDHAARLLTQRHDVVLAEHERRDRDALAVHRHVAVAHELPSLVAARREARTEHDVVNAELEQA